MKDDLQKLIDFLWEEHRGGVLGALLGTAVAVLILLFGFWRMVFVLLFALAGLWLGTEADSGDGTWIHRLRKVKFSELLRLKRS